MPNTTLHATSPPAYDNLTGHDSFPFALLFSPTFHSSFPGFMRLLFPGFLHILISKKICKYIPRRSFPFGPILLLTQTVISDIFTGRCSSSDFFAASPIRTGSSPSITPSGVSVSFSIASIKHLISFAYAAI